ncbi:TrmB family transcriptional regulator [Haloplanus halophilus]|uniref:TrmB family transcriptional regulator n=1 Tax=Haloplanus halophilus TaxID=2949993 RepID=UPI00203B2A03|nr:helix-turn-helix domain-containing protein [Haloplanus sp. GDY1]
MSSQPEIYLQEMGLSEYEAATYVGLLQGGTSTAKEVASRAGVPQSRVYDVLDSLNTKGFVVVQEGRPKKFGPVEPNQAVSQFRDFKRREHVRRLDEIQGLGEHFLDAVDEADYGDEGDDEVDISWSYPNRHHILEKLERLAEDATEEILMITTPESFERIANHHAELLAAKADAGVEIRALISDDRDLDPAVRDRATELMTIRFVQDIRGRLYTYDGENVLLAFRAPNDDGYVGISTTSPHLYATLSQLFELLWEDGVPVS